jgi:hypothetical protein
LPVLSSCLLNASLKETGESALRGARRVALLGRETGMNWTWKWRSSAWLYAHLLHIEVH